MTERTIRRTILWVFAAVGAASFTFVIVAFLAIQLAGWSKKEWPPIESGHALVLACNALLETHPEGEIDPAKLPAPIRALAPRYVSTRGNAVYILISSGGIGSGWGYLVTPKADAVAGRFLRGNRVWGSGHENVFRFITNE